MSTDLHRAFITLGLEPGASWDEVKEQHILLAQGLHPDRFSGKKKTKAEDKLKQINNARDVLKAHFDSDHKDADYCACKQSGTTAGAQSTENDANEREAKAAKARQRDAQRKAEEKAEQESAKRSQQESTESEQGNFVQDLEQAYKGHAESKRGALYWKISVGCIVWLLGCFAYGNIMKGAYNSQSLYDDYNKEQASVSRDVETKWQAYQLDKQRVIERISGEKPSLASVERWTPPYEDVYQRLKAAVQKQKEDRDRYDQSPHYWQGGLIPPSSVSGQNQKIIDDLNRTISYNQGVMDKWKRKVDEYDAMLKLGAAGGNIQQLRNEAYQNYESARNARDNAKRQVDNLTKGPTTVEDLTDPYHYSRDKNPWGTGTRPPGSLSPRRDQSLSIPGSFGNRDLSKEKYPNLSK